MFLWNLDETLTLVIKYFVYFFNFLSEKVSVSDFRDESERRRKY